jgi:hypothetical protein
MPAAALAQAVAWPGGGFWPRHYRERYEAAKYRHRFWLLPVSRRHLGYRFRQLRSGLGGGCRRHLRIASCRRVRRLAVPAAKLRTLTARAAGERSSQAVRPDITADRTRSARELSVTAVVLIAPRGRAGDRVCGLHTAHVLGAALAVPASSGGGREDLEDFSATNRGDVRSSFSGESAIERRLS